MSDPSGSSAPVLEDHDGFVESMYHLLWAKDFAGEPCGGILVPDTIIYKYRIPAYWYFTGSDGRLKRKNKSSIVNKKIYADFTRGARGPNDIVACHICESRMQTDDDDDGDEPEAEGDSARPPRQKETVIRHFDSRSLHDFLFHHEKLDDGCLIKFVRPKGLFNSTIQAAWSPQMCLLERRVNIHPLLSGRVPLQQRTATYEGGEHLSNISPVRGTLLADKVQQLCWSIVTHIQATSLRHHKTSRMLLNFKTDAEDNVWFLWCSSIRLYPEEGSEAERLMDISTPKPRPSLGSSKSVASGLLAGGTAGAAGTTNKKGPRKLSASASVAAGMGAEPLSACCINPALSSPAKPPVPKHMRPLASVCPFTSKLLESNHPYFVTYKTVIEYSNLLDARTGRKRPREEIPPLLARVATDLDPSSWLKDRGNPLFLYRRVLVSQAAYLELTTSAMPGMRVLPAISAKEKRAMILGPAKSLPVLPPMAAKLERAATGRIPSAERPGRLERAGTQLPVRLANPT